MAKLTASFFDHIDDIDSKHWDSLGCCNNTYYSPQFFKAFELAHDDIEFKYIIIFRGEEAIAFANTQIVTISIETITKNIKISDTIKRNINNFIDMLQAFQGLIRHWLLQALIKMLTQNRIKRLVD